MITMKGELITPRAGKKRQESRDNTARPLISLVVAYLKASQEPADYRKIRVTRKAFQDHLVLRA